MQLLLQAAAALGYYAALLLLMRLSGKRLAGQTTTFDLLVLISLAVVMQNVALRPGALTSAVFVITVFSAHRLVTFGCSRSPRLRKLLRGTPRTLVRDGTIDTHALAAENLSEAELHAGLRKLGIDRLSDVKVAALEETGHISAVRK